MNGPDPFSPAGRFEERRRDAEQQRAAERMAAKAKAMELTRPVDVGPVKRKREADGLAWDEPRLGDMTDADFPTGIAHLSARLAGDLGQWPPEVEVPLRAIRDTLPSPTEKAYAP